MALTEVQLIIDELRAAWRARDIPRVANLYAADYEGVDVGQRGPQRGPAGVVQSLALYVQAFPDIQLTLDEAIVQGNRAALIYTVRGTHTGSIMRIPATGRTIEIQGVSLITVEHGQITHGAAIWDVAGLLRTIGLLPELSA
jgi:steroid delta-isomerase-like uncharacterized protein